MQFHIDTAMTLLRSHLSEETRITHSRRVASMMSELSRVFGEDDELWSVTGLLHDIDLSQTLSDLSKHGILAADMLDGLIPNPAVQAIRTHERSTGLHPESLLGEALIFADMLEIMIRTAHEDALLSCSNTRDWTPLRTAFPTKLYHIEVLETFLNDHPDVDLPRILLALDTKDSSGGYKTPSSPVGRKPRKPL